VFAVVDSITILRGSGMANDDGGFEVDIDELDDVDFVLQALAKAANDVGFRMGITLSVGGALITGTLVGGREYFEHFGREFKDAYYPAHAPDEESLGRLNEVFDDLAKRYDKASLAEDHPNAHVELRPAYIHLRKAQVIHGDLRIPTSERGLWRGRLTAVDGFFLGTVQ
jgi:hypothetical protein